MSTKLIPSILTLTLKVQSWKCKNLWVCQSLHTKIIFHKNHIAVSDLTAIYCLQKEKTTKMLQSRLRKCYSSIATQTYTHQMLKWSLISNFARVTGSWKQITIFAIKNISRKLKILTEQKTSKPWILLFIKLHACIKLYEC